MSNGCDHDALVGAFTSRRSATGTRAIRDAYLDRHADQLLSQMLDAAADASVDKVTIAAHLGDLSGTDGDAALRRAIGVAGPGTWDLPESVRHP